MWFLTVAPYLFLAASARTILTGELLANIDKVRIEQNVKGLAISVIHDGIAERAVQGIKTETGEPMDEDVRPLFVYEFYSGHENRHCSISHHAPSHSPLPLWVCLSTTFNGVSMLRPCLQE
jgi:hypothetical protein